MIDLSLAIAKQLQELTDTALANPVTLPEEAYALLTMGQAGEEYVVHTEGDVKCVYLFEDREDASSVAEDAQTALGVSVRIELTAIDTLHFRCTRFKPRGSRARLLPLKEVGNEAINEL